MGLICCYLTSFRLSDNVNIRVEFKCLRCSFFHHDDDNDLVHCSNLVERAFSLSSYSAAAVCYFLTTKLWNLNNFCIPCSLFFFFLGGGTGL